MITISGFSADSRVDKVIITDRDGSSISMAPGECGPFTKFLTYCSSMLQLGKVPTTLASAPFRAEFYPGGGCKVSRQDAPGSIDMPKGTQDDIVKLVDLALAKYLDSKRLNKTSRRPNRPAPFMPDPIS